LIFTMWKLLVGVIALVQANHLSEPAVPLEKEISALRAETQQLKALLGTCQGLSYHADAASDLTTRFLLESTTENEHPVRRLGSSRCPPHQTTAHKNHTLTMHSSSSSMPSLLGQALPRSPCFLGFRVCSIQWYFSSLA